MRLPLCLLALSLFSLSNLAHAQNVIVSDFSSWNGSTATGLAFGAGTLGTVGETFKAPSANLVLNNFTFWIRDDGINDRAVTFKAYLYEWNGSHAIGSALWSSTATYTVPNVGLFASNPFLPYIFNMGGLLLNPAKTYVAFLETPTSYNPFTDVGGAFFAYTNDNSYANGQYVYSFNGGGLNNITSDWTSYSAGIAGPGTKDLVFKASFTAVPEPSTYALIGSSALLGLAALRRRRRAN